MRKFEKLTTMLFIYMISIVISLPPIYACSYCGECQPPHRHPSPRPRSPPCYNKKPPHHGGNKGHGAIAPPIYLPPTIIPTPPIITPPPVVIAPPSARCPPTYGPPGNPGAPGVPGFPPIVMPGTPRNPDMPDTPNCPGNCNGQKGNCCGRGQGFSPTPTIRETCPINALKLGLCLDVLGGLVHIGIGDPTTNVCCPVLQGLLEIEAALCLCTAIRIKVLNINIFIPLALSVLVQCGLTPPPGFICPPPS